MRQDLTVVDLNRPGSLKRRQLRRVLKSLAMLRTGESISVVLLTLRVRPSGTPSRSA